jgi:serine/threonine protein kinase
MTTYTSEPGTRLGGRYRLEDRIAAGPGWDAWKAIDETLARAVTVFTFASGFPRIAEVVRAARAASRLTDPRLAQVFDVEDSFENAYIVMEWAAGETLGDMLSAGPLEPGRACRIMVEVATALSAAHAVGIAHLCLSPGSVRWTPTGEVKVVGLGIDAALSGTAAEDPALADTIGLGRLLYAALTAHWPGPEYPALPEAPVADGQPCAPRQVVAGVPLPLSDLACRAMQLQGRHDHGASVASPDQVASELTALLPPLPVPAEWQQGARNDHAARHVPRRRDTPPAETNGYWQSDVSAADSLPDLAAWMAGSSGELPPVADPPWPASARSHRRSTRRRARALPLRAPIAVGVLVAVIAAAAVIAFILLSGGGGPTGRSRGTHTVAPASVTTLRPVGAAGFDPLNPSDAGNENSKYARYAINGDPQTAWTTQWYASPQFGGLKAGAGLIIDLGQPARVTSVTVTFGTLPGADVELLAGNSDARTGATLHSMTTLATASSPTGTYTFTVRSPAVGRFLVIWFTRLPPKPGSGHWFMASVSSVVIKGSAG